VGALGNTISSAPTTRDVSPFLGSFFSSKNVLPEAPFGHFWEPTDRLALFGATHRSSGEASFALITPAPHLGPVEGITQFIHPLHLSSFS